MRTVLDAMSEHAAKVTRDSLEALAAMLEHKTGVPHKLYASPTGVAVYPETVGRTLGYQEV